MHDITGTDKLTGERVLEIKSLKQITVILNAVTS